MGGIRLDRRAHGPSGAGDRAHGNDARRRNLARPRLGAGAHGIARQRPRSLRTLMPFDSILFDFDGVLIDSEPVHWACWAEVLKPLGVTLRWDFYRDHCIGIDDREMLRMMATQSDP